MSDVPQPTLTFGLLAAEFSVPSASPDEVLDALFGLATALRNQSSSDAERVGEALRVVAARPSDALGVYTGIAELRVEGRMSRRVYAKLTLPLGGAITVAVLRTVARRLERGLNQPDPRDQNAWLEASEAEWLCNRCGEVFDTVDLRRQHERDSHHRHSSDRSGASSR